MTNPNRKNNVEALLLKQYPEVFSFFYQLIANKDRHFENYLTVEGVVVGIDHGLAFLPPDLESSKEFVGKE